MTYTIEKITEPKDVATLMGLYAPDSFRNPLLLGDLTAPMNKISDAYKVINANGHIQAGFTIFYGSTIPVIVFPYGQTEHWDRIKDFINQLNLQEFFIINLTATRKQPNERILPPPWVNWDTYLWEHQHVDISMKFTAEQLDIVSTEGLPEFRGAKVEDYDKVQKFMDRYYQDNFFIKEQLESEMSVIVEEKGDIIAFGGTHFETPYTVQIGNIFVREDFRNRGIGRAVTIAVTLGVYRSKRVPTLFVNEKNLSAIKLYESIGFEEDHRFSWTLAKQKEKNE